MSSILHRSRNPQIAVRPYAMTDWEAIERIHDAARRMELELAGLPEAFLPLRTAAAREGLFEYSGLFVAEQNGRAVGFAALHGCMWIRRICGREWQARLQSICCAPSRKFTASRCYTEICLPAGDMSGWALP